MCACAVEVPRVRDQSSNEHVESILFSSAMSRLLAPPSWGHRGRAPWPHLRHTYTVSPWSRYGGAWIKGELIGKARLDVKGTRSRFAHVHEIHYVMH